MNQPVTLKGVKSGIILKLSGEGDFEKLLPQIEKKFRESASFFGNKHMILSIEGRDVDDEEAGQILELLVKTHHCCSQQERKEEDRTCRG